MFSALLLALLQSTADAAGKVTGGVNFDVSVGDLISIATTIIGVLASYVRLRERIVAIETKLDPMWETFLERRQKPRS